MKNKYFIPALVLLAFSCEKKQSQIVAEKSPEKNQISLPVVKTEQAEDLFPEIPFKEIPVTDSTNFDNLIEKNPLNQNLISKLGLEKISPETETFFAQYKLKISHQFRSVVITSKKEHEMITFLINYDKNGSVKGFQEIAYDEIAESALRKSGVITKEKIKTETINYFDDPPQITLQNYQIEKGGKIEEIQ